MHVTYIHIQTIANRIVLTFIMKFSHESENTIINSSHCSHYIFTKFVFLRAETNWDHFPNKRAKALYQCLWKRIKTFFAQIGYLWEGMATSGLNIYLLFNCLIFSFSTSYNCFGGVHESLRSTMGIEILEFKWLRSETRRQKLWEHRRMEEKEV